MGERRFVVELIKPSHYDDDGYVIQWVRSWIPSNSLACLYAIAQDAAAPGKPARDVRKPFQIRPENGYTWTMPG